MLAETQSMAFSGLLDELLPAASLQSTGQSGN